MSPAAVLDSRATMRLVNTLLFWFVFMAFGALAIVYFFSQGAFGGEDLFGLGKIMGLAQAAMVLSLVLNARTFGHPSALTVVVGVWMPWAVMSSLGVLMDADLSAYVYSMLLPMLFWALSYQFFCESARRSPALFSRMQCAFFYLSIGSSLLYLSSYQFQSLRFGNTRVQLNAVYFTLATLPWVLTQRRRLWRVGAVLLIALAVYSSLKRTALVALLAGGIAYFLIGLMVAPRRERLRHLGLAIVCAIAGIMSFVWIDDALDNAFSMRVGAVIDDQGTGRIGIYKAAAESLDKLSTGRWLLGGGHGAVQRAIGVSAHNDWLEVMFDFGLVGLCLYSAIHVLLLRRLGLLTRARSEYAPAYAACYAVFFVFSAISHLIIYPTYFIYITAFWGAVEGVSTTTSHVQDRFRGSHIKDGVAIDTSLAQCSTVRATEWRGA